VGWALFFMAIATMGAQFIIGGITYYYRPELYDSDWYNIVISALSVVGIGYPVFTVIIHKIPDSEHGEVAKLSVSQFIMMFFVCTAVMYLSSLVGSLISYAISGIKGSEVINPIEELINNSNMVLTVIYAAIIAPILEETIFRKFLLNKVRRFGDLPAMLISGLAFGLFHLNISQFFYAAALGIVFAYIAIRTNTIVYTIILHMMINTIGSVIAPLVLFSGNVTALELLSVWVIASVIIGTVFFARNRKGILIEKGIIQLERKKDYFLHGGAILYLLVCIAMMVYQVLL
jgi:membrane protease YdiL (CAAX protease family)